MIVKILERLEAERKICLEESALISASCIQRIKEIVQEVAKDGGWIPCSERLPEAHKNVLVCENDGEIHLCRYNANMKRFFYDGSDWDIKLSEVIAWQLLPAPYQKGV